MRWTQGCFYVFFCFHMFFLIFSFDAFLSRFSLCNILFLISYKYIIKRVGCIKYIYLKTLNLHMVKQLQICAQIKGMAILIIVAQHDNQLETTSNIARGQMYSQTNGRKLVEWKRNDTSKHFILTDTRTSRIPEWSDEWNKARNSFLL